MKVPFNNPERPLMKAMRMKVSQPAACLIEKHFRLMVPQKLGVQRRAHNGVRHRLEARFSPTAIWTLYSSVSSTSTDEENGNPTEPATTVSGSPTIISTPLFILPTMPPESVSVSTISQSPESVSVSTTSQSSSLTSFSSNSTSTTGVEAKTTADHSTKGAMIVGIVTASLLASLGFITLLAFVRRRRNMKAREQRPSSFNPTSFVATTRSHSYRASSIGSGTPLVPRLGGQMIQVHRTTSPPSLPANSDSVSVESESRPSILNQDLDRDIDLPSDGETVSLTTSSARRSVPPPRNNRHPRHSIAASRFNEYPNPTRHAPQGSVETMNTIPTMNMNALTSVYTMNFLASSLDEFPSPPNSIPASPVSRYYRDGTI